MSSSALGLEFRNSGVCFVVVVVVAAAAAGCVCVCGRGALTMAWLLVVELRVDFAVLFGFRVLVSGSFCRRIHVCSPLKRVGFDCCFRGLGFRVWAWAYTLVVRNLRRGDRTSGCQPSGAVTEPVHSFKSSRIYGVGAPNCANYRGTLYTKLDIF